MILVKFVRLMTQVKEFGLEDGSTVAELCDEVGVEFVHGCLSIGGSIVCADHALNNGDIVTYGDKIKGNVDFEVKFIRLGQGAAVSVMVSSGTTIGSAISAMDEVFRDQFIRPDGNHSFEYQIPGMREVSGTSVIPDPAAGSSEVRVICAQKIKGNLHRIIKSIRKFFKV